MPGGLQVGFENLLRLLVYKWLHDMRGTPFDAMKVRTEQQGEIQCDGDVFNGMVVRTT